MATISNKFHELGNWHNKIGMGTIVTKEALSDPNLLQLPPEELKEVIDKAVKTLEKFEDFITGADKCVNEIKPFVYGKLGRDTEIPLRIIPGAGMDEDMGAGLTMLILDDEKDLCDFSRRFFEKRGFIIQTALTIKDALSKISKTKFDVALLDQHMKNGSGLDVLKAFREKQPQCQCIMLTVEENKTIVSSAKKMGVADYLFKPVALLDIEKAIKKVIKKVKGKAK